MSKLYSPFQIGAIRLDHRIVQSPLTRLRSDQPGGRAERHDGEILQSAAPRKAVCRSPKQPRSRFRAAVISARPVSTRTRKLKAGAR